jgi:uncharacterized protein
MQRLIYLWLLTLGAGHIVLGIALALGVQSALLAPYFDTVLEQFALPGSDTAARNMAQSLIQLFGPTVASWGLLFSGLVYLYRQRGEGGIKWLIFAALLLWLPLDCLISARHGLYLQVYLNLCVGLLIALPLALLKPLAAVASSPAR